MKYFIPRDIQYFTFAGMHAPQRQSCLFSKMSQVPRATSAWYIVGTQ